MDKDSNNKERNEGATTRMTAFQMAMAQKDGTNAPPPPKSHATEPVRQTPQSGQAGNVPLKGPVRPIPLVPPEVKGGAAKDGAASSLRSPQKADRPTQAVPPQRRIQRTAETQATGSFSLPSAMPRRAAPKSHAKGAADMTPRKIPNRPAPVAVPSPSEKEPQKKVIFERLFGRDNDGYVQRKMSRARRLAIVIFALVSLISLVLCTWGSYSVSGLSIRENSQIILANKSDSKNYRIVYSTEDAFGADAATSLQSHLLAKTGATLSIVPDTEAPAKNEIRIGYTKRAPDSYITSLGSLGRNGYAIIFGANGGVDLIAFSRVGAEAAIMCFTDGYGVSYLAGNLNFASSSNLAYVSRDGSEPDTSLYESKLTLGFGSDGKFKMLVFSDPDINTNTISAMEAMLDEEKPDLVILNGDVSSGISTKSELEEYLRVLCAPMESRRIAWCHINGEQDGDAGLSVTLQNEVYSSFKYCVSKSDFESFGASSYFLPVFADSSAEKGSAPLFGVWMLGQTGLISNSPVAPGGSDGFLNSVSGEGKDYGYVTQSHVDWFSNSASLMKKDREKGIPSIAVTHTPVDEFNIIAENPDKCAFDGVMAEKVSASPVQSGLFAALLEAKSVLGLYCGHDHLNNFSGKYLGIELGYAASIGYDGYGHGGTFENNNSARGGRVIEATLIGESVSVSSRFAFASEYGITRE